jgi:hypothetical protein
LRARLALEGDERRRGERGKSRQGKTGAFVSGRLSFPSSVSVAPWWMDGSAPPSLCSWGGHLGARWSHKHSYRGREGDT